MILLVLSIAIAVPLSSIDACVDGDPAACAVNGAPPRLEAALLEAACLSGALDACTRASTHEHLHGHRRKLAIEACRSAPTVEVCTLANAGEAYDIDVVAQACTVGIWKACDEAAARLGLDALPSHWTWVPHPRVDPGDRLFVRPDGSLRAWGEDQLEEKVSETSLMWSPGARSCLVPRELVYARDTGRWLDWALPRNHSAEGYADQADRLLRVANQRVRIWENGEERTPSSWRDVEAYGAVWANAQGTSVVSHAYRSMFWLREDSTIPLQRVEPVDAASEGGHLLAIAHYGVDLYDENGTRTAGWPELKADSLLLAPDDSWLAIPKRGGVIVLGLSEDATLPMKVVRPEVDPIALERVARVEPFEGTTVEVVDPRGEVVFAAPAASIVALPDDLPKGVRVRARSDKLDSGYVQPSSASLSITLSPKPVHAIEVSVVDSTGAPVPDAMVWTRRLDHGRTDASGHVSLRAWKNDPTDWLAVDRRGRAARDTSRSPGSLVLRAAPLQEDGRWDLSREPQVAIIHDEDAVRTEVMADSDEAFPIHPWSDGTLLIRTSRHEYPRLVDTLGLSPATEPVVDGRLSWPRARLTPVEQDGRNHLFQRDDGLIRRAYAQFDRIEPGSWSGRRLRDGHIETTAFTVEPGKTHTLAWTSAPGRTIRGRITDPEGWPMPHARVSAWSHLISPKGELVALGYLSTRADGAGRYELGELAEGTTLVWSNDDRAEGYSYAGVQLLDTQDHLDIQVWIPPIMRPIPPVDVGFSDGAYRVLHIRDPQWVDGRLEVGDVITHIEGLAIGPWAKEDDHTFDALFYLEDRVRIAVLRKGRPRRVRLPSWTATHAELLR